ncbi:radical SAM protein with 4Fe4S-binding SPASM domain [Anaerobacterium chartisolvens]|uniref:Radical SAM protein with 4Fe4S-binding SPASM domain n=1 Tax=Anaerobacterium chartisolvens TaxID=1297424 RepID=A0A369B5W3_9FIRM|nr:radical SAM protein [Anaerobacterium chartisolvens]RCX16890.1 radical SAM protein with 4Fe4S-binding SPASM domain [Anaerobacterium chartisolvens]
MSDKFVTGITPGGKRTVLGEVLPLSTPFLIQIFPVYGCNFKCGYCLHAIPRAQHGHISSKTFMDMALYKKCIDEMRLFDKPLKMLRFAGIGEPLLHRDIAEMISYAKSRQIADSIDIVTNGALLTDNLSLSLINSGLDKLRVSIQGVSAEKYKSISGVDIDLASFVESLMFFYKNRGKTKVYIKIIDCALSDKDEEKKFLEMFGPLCDTISIEHLTPTVSNIDYQRLSQGKDFKTTQSGNCIMEANICPQPFYMMQINPDGCVVPCCSTAYPRVLGNVLNEDIYRIWNGKEFSSFRRTLLDGVEACGSICKSCSLYKYGLFPEDILDPYVSRLKSLY